MLLNENFLASLQPKTLRITKYILLSVERNKHQ